MPFSQYTTHITTSTSDQQHNYQQNNNSMQQQYYMYSNMDNNSLLSNNDTVGNETVVYYFQEEYLEDLEEECRRKVRLPDTHHCVNNIIQTSTISQTSQLRRNPTRLMPQTNQISMTKPTIVERHSILPITKDSNSNAFYGKPKYTNSNIGSMIATQTTSESLRISPQQSSMLNLHSIGNDMPHHDDDDINTTSTSQPTQPTQPSTSTLHMNESNLIHTTAMSHITPIVNSYTDVSNTTNNLILEEDSITNNNSNFQQHCNSISSARLTDDLVFDLEFLSHVYSDEFSSDDADLDKLNDFQNSTKEGNFSNKSNNKCAASSSGISDLLPRHIEIPPPLLAPLNQQTYYSPQNCNNSIGATSSSNTVHGSTTSNKKRKQSVANTSSSALVSHHNLLPNMKNDKCFANALSMPAFPTTNCITYEEPDDDKPKRKRGRPPKQ